MPRKPQSKTLCEILILILLFLILGSALTASAQQTLQEKLGYPASARVLVLHADDLGMNHSVNRATFEALEKGWITSASIMAPCPWFAEVARWAQAHPDADLGIHLVLNSEWTDVRWGPVAPSNKVSSLLDANGYFTNDPDLLKHAKMPEVAIELRAQIEKARAAGIRISHFDSHMAALMSSPELFQVYAGLGTDYHMPVLNERSGTHAAPAGAAATAGVRVDRVITMEPGVSAKDWFDWYKKQLAPLGPGVYQMVVHLAHDDDEMRGATWDHPDWGARWRQSDLDMVGSPEFRQFLRDQGFILIRWSDLAKALPSERNVSQ